METALTILVFMGIVIVALWFCAGVCLVIVIWREHREFKRSMEGKRKIYDINRRH